MMDKAAIRTAIENNKIEWQRHALERIMERGISKEFLLRLATMIPKCFLPDVMYFSCRMRKCFLLWVKKVRCSTIALSSCFSSLALSIPASTVCKTSNPLLLKLEAIFTGTSSSRYREMNSFSAGKLRIILFYHIFSNVFLNFVTMVGIITQCVKYLGKGKVRKVFQNFFRRRPEFSPFNNGAHRRSRAFDNGLSSKDIIVANNIWMFSSCNHFNNPILPCSLNY